nr:MmgE/PrpD family protein [Mycobacterium sp. NAZ190054]
MLQHAAAFGAGGRWAVASHVLDLDDLHLPSTAHVSAVCVPATLATGGGSREFLTGAGVMARIGTILGWRHYESGWHATTTSGAIGAAACAAAAYGLDVDLTARAIALAVPASGGVQRVFGTEAKSLQVGFAVDAGVRAAALARDGAGVDITSLDAWLPLVGAGPVPYRFPDLPAVPDGLAIKLHPCCYAMQRPIAAVHEVRDRVAVGDITRIVVRTLAGTVAPLIHPRPHTGLEGKFSLEYAVATALLDRNCWFASFSDQAVHREEAQRLVGLVEVEMSSGGAGLLDGDFVIEIHTIDGPPVLTRMQVPPGAPQRPPSPSELGRKVADCLVGSGVTSADITWSAAPRLLDEAIPAAGGHLITATAGSARID